MTEVSVETCFTNLKVLSFSSNSWLACYYPEVVIGYKNVSSVKCSALVSCKSIDPYISCLGLPWARKILGKDNLTPWHTIETTPTRVISVS